MSALANVTFRDETGADLKPWMVRAGMLILETDYATNGNALICVVRADAVPPDYKYKPTLPR